MRRIIVAATLLAMLAGCAALTAGVDHKRLLNADSEPGEWFTVGRGYDEQRYSPLARINTGNVSQLGLAWYADFDTNRGQEASPLVIDGVLYVTSAWSKVYAFNAKSGKALWSFDPKVPGQIGIVGCCDVVNRGLAAWGGNVYVGSYDGRLIALNAKTGKVVWSVVTVDQTKAYTSTGAPRIANGKVIIGNAGSDLGVRGYVSAYDARSGKQLWRFYTVPGDPTKPYENEQMRKAAATWTGDLYWKLGGGTVWDGIVYEPATNMVYFGTANGTPWVAEIRAPQGGDNLFLNSIIAVNADTGQYAWHYQTTPAETWDYDATSPLMMADLNLDGSAHRVVMQISKNGFFYALDATSGKLLRAKNYTPVSWATHVDMQTGRPVEVPAARFGKTGKPVVVQPGGQGAHSWHPMAFSRRTNLLYTPVVETSQGFAPDPNYVPRLNAPNAATGRAPPTVYEGVHADVPRTARGYLIAWDPVTTREVWRSDLRGTIASGVLATAGGLVFQGAQRGELSAYRDTDGKKLWSTDPQTGVVAAPVTYEIDGEQYVAQLAGYGNRDYYADNNSRLLVYKLGGKAQLPPLIVSTPRPLNPPSAFGSAEQLARGERVYNDNCTMCHDTALGNRGLFPDLRYSPMINTREAFHSVVIDGALAPRGMGSFRSRFGADDAEAVRAYITQRARAALPQAAPQR